MIFLIILIIIRGMMTMIQDYDEDYHGDEYRCRE